MHGRAMIVAGWMGMSAAAAWANPEDAAAIRTAHVSLHDALRIAKEKFPSALVREIEFRRGDNARYEVSMISDGQLHEVEISAGGGSVQVESKPFAERREKDLRELWDQMKEANADLARAMDAAAAYLPEATLTEAEVEVKRAGTKAEIRLATKDASHKVEVDVKTYEVVEVDNRPAFRGAQERGGSIVFAFDRDAPGSLPAGWRSSESSKGAPTAAWDVRKDASAPSPTQILGVSATDDSPEGQLNVCWTSAVKLADAKVECRFRADSGKKDQGGGVIWRVANERTYYLTRVSTIEKKVTIERVKDGVRNQLASADLAIPSGEWHTLRIEHTGEHIRCFVDNAGVAEAKDAAIPDAGGIGVWTKADASTSFDSVTVTPASAKAAK